MAKRKSNSKRSTLQQPVPHWIAYVVLGALFLLAIKLVKIISGFSNLYW